MPTLAHSPHIKPYAVTRATRILWLWVAFLMISGVYQGWTDTARLSGVIPADLITISDRDLFYIMTGFNIVVALTMVGLIVETSRGKNWGRLMLLLSFLCDLGLSVLSPPDSIASYVIDAVDLSMQVTALWLLFTAPGRHWFGRRERTDA